MITGPALLFCPGDRPDRYAKAFERADSVIIDLEDAVAPADKEAARAALVSTPLDPARVIVRVNPRTSEFFAADIAAVEQTAYRTIMLPKAEQPSDLDGLEAYDVIALCETPLGVRDADALAADPRVTALTWGAEDLVAAIGGFKSRTPDGGFGKLAEYSRARVLIAAAAAGKPPTTPCTPTSPMTRGCARRHQRPRPPGSGAQCACIRARCRFCGRRTCLTPRRSRGRRACSKQRRRRRAASLPTMAR